MRPYFKRQVSLMAGPNEYDVRGITVVEILFGVAIMASFIGLLTLAFMLYLQVSTAGPKHTAAVFLADEGIEAVRTIRGRGWEDNIAILDIGTTYYLYLSDDSWTATTTEQAVDGDFIREFVLSEVERDVSGSITDGLGTLDSDSRRVDVTVRWDGLVGRSEIEMSVYIMDIF